MPAVSKVFQECPQLQVQRSPFRGDQPHNGQRMRGPELSLVLSRARSITGAVGHIREYYAAHFDGQCGSVCFFASMTHWGFRTTATMLDSAGWTRTPSAFKGLCVCERSVPQPSLTSMENLKVSLRQQQQHGHLPCLRAPFYPRFDVGVRRSCKKHASIPIKLQPITIIDRVEIRVRGKGLRQNGTRHRVGGRAIGSAVSVSCATCFLSSDSSRSGTHESFFVSTRSVRPVLRKYGTAKRFRRHDCPTVRSLSHSSANFHYAHSHSPLSTSHRAPDALTHAEQYPYFP
jgi:hypothetical protein